jgi:hypothetical protein
MEKLQKEILQITKEIVVKFVEVGRVTPANFADVFPSVYAVVLEAVGTEKQPDEPVRYGGPPSRPKLKDDKCAPPKVIAPGA